MVRCHHRRKASDPASKGTAGHLWKTGPGGHRRRGAGRRLDHPGGKGSTEFGIGASIAEVVRAIFHDENRILPVSVLLDGQYGQHDVYASVPALLNKDGVADIIELNLTPDEQEKFNASCKTMNENYQLSLTL